MEWYSDASMQSEAALDQKLHRRLREFFRGLSSRQIAEFVRAPELTQLNSIIDLILEHPTSKDTLSNSFSKDQLSKLSLLWIAVLSHCYDSAELLVRSGAEVNELFGQRQESRRIDEKWTILHLLAQTQASPANDKLIWVVVNSGADLRVRDSRGSTVLHIATGQCRVQITRMLLEREADANAADDMGVTPFMVAASSSKADDLLPMFMNCGTDFSARDYRGRNVLHRLDTRRTHEGSVDLARVLIEKGASLDDEDDYWNQPIHQAVFWGNNELVKLYLDHGADANALTENGKTPLHLAAGSGYARVVKTLLERGADVKKRTIAEGYTPLHTACRSTSRNFDDNKDLSIRLLLSAGADVLAEDYFGNTSFAFVMANYDGTQHRARSSIGLMIRKLAFVKVCQPSRNLKDERSIGNHEEMADYYRNCIEQVERTKSTRFFQNYTFFDLLAKCSCRIAGYMRNPDFESNFRKYDLSQLSMCADDLRRAFERGKRHHEIMLEFEDLLNEAVDYVLPQFFIENVVSHLCKCVR